MYIPTELIDPFFNDAEFRASFLKDPEQAARSRGHRLDVDTAERLRELDPAMVSKMVQDATFKMATC